MENAVESRIIELGDDGYSLRHGPFDNDDFSSAQPWTLLVQSVDTWVPEVALMRQLVQFLPRWRMDDIMVSYASDGGGVGPHYDNYDVFLLQGEGRRRWRIGQWCDSDEPLLNHPELRLLADFRQEHEFLLEPGDILYVPPRIAHWGIADGECTTFSLGFRAPRVNDMLSRWVDSALEQFDGDSFYADPRIEPVVRPGEIRRHDRERVALQLQAAVDQIEGDAWFGELVTEPRDPESLPVASAASHLNALRHPGTVLSLHPAARIAWQQEQDAVSVFCNGHSLPIPSEHLPLIIELCDTSEFTADAIDSLLAAEHGRQLMLFLLESGAFDVEQ